MPTADLTLPELVAWGERFGASLEAPALVTLAGDLGAGKTTLVQAICRGRGVTEPVTSPTFALVHQYAAPAAPVYHLDLYRLKGPHELANIGWDDVLSARAVVCVEWPDRAGDTLPAPAAAIELSHIPEAPDRRRLRW
ncbi:MAG: tRNA (adenosine(37)-N6)-threonylcarbamoyltransferase complex ATPase subunit type 1 TsaE [Gemmatimonadetes bacterium]|nr:tRNA (adenosine(37)-N6)-threonylcarbamoyltransferase complex ATPase subunit type 1 TsaE [Gemmatimonadota bacterium]MBI3566627.1 tRNA (adenosine(37)-N6)-threonylcarbamoyltransferase complex ATPase subunit type 1 TsaE [Gemmatimonadota bacterium]